MQDFKTSEAQRAPNLIDTILFLPNNGLLATSHEIDTSHSFHFLLLERPHLENLKPPTSATLLALCVGSNKISCLSIPRLSPVLGDAQPFRICRRTKPREEKKNAKSSGHHISLSRSSREQKNVEKEFLARSFQRYLFQPKPLSTTSFVPFHGVLDKVKPKMISKSCAAGGKSSRHATALRNPHFFQSKTNKVNSPGA